MFTARAWTLCCSRMAYSSFSFLSCSCSWAFSASARWSWPWQVDNTWGVEVVLNLPSLRWISSELVGPPPPPPDLKVGTIGPHHGLCSQSLPSCPGLLLGSLQLLTQCCPVDMGVRFSETQDGGLPLPLGNNCSLHCAR